MNATDEIIDVETREIIVAPPTAIFGTSEPVEVLQKAQAIATALKAVVKSQGLITNIQGKEYPRCEAWTTLGSMLGVFPVLEWTRKLDNGWEARVEAKTLTGAVVGAAEAECTRDEKSWANRDDFALRSMAQTRATAKALRMPLGFVMTLGGFEATPAEEMTFDSTPIRGGENRPKGPDGAPSRPPSCKEHGSMRFIKGGTSKAGKPYDSFWGCTEKSCKTTVNAVQWDDHLRNEAREKSDEVIDLGDLPFEE